MGLAGPGLDAIKAQPLAHRNGVEPADGRVILGALSIQLPPRPFSMSPSPSPASSSACDRRGQILLAHFPRRESHAEGAIRFGVRASSTNPRGHLVQSMDRIEVKTGIHSDPIDETRLAGIIVHANARTLVNHHEIFVLQLYPVHV